MIPIKKYIKYLGNVVAVLSIIFVIWTVIRLDIDFSQVKSIPMFIIVGIGEALLVSATVYGMAFAWKMILQFLSEKKVEFKSAGKIYAKANIGKYMPGNVMHYVERNLFATKLGLNQLDVATSSVIEALGQVLTAIILSIVLAHREFFETIQNMVSPKMLVIIGGILIVGCAVVIVLYKRMDNIQAIIHRMMNVKFIWIMLKVMVVYGIVLVCQGLLLMLICRYVLQCDLTEQQALLIIAYYVLAWVVGFIVPGAPGGIGVREMIIVMLMNGVISEEIILVAALIHRLVSVLGDILAYVYSMLIKDKKEDTVLEQ